MPSCRAEHRRFLAIRARTRSSSATPSGRSCPTTSCSRGWKRSAAGPPRLPIPTWEEVKKNLPPAIAAPADADRLEPRLLGLRARAGRPLERLHPHDVGRGQPGPRLRGEPVLGPDPRHPLQLLHGALRDAAGGRRPRQGRDRRAHPERWPATTGPASRPAEQRAYAYARKLTEAPWELTDGRLHGPRERPRPERGDGHLLVALPRAST